MMLTAHDNLITVALWPPPVLPLQLQELPKRAAFELHSPDSAVSSFELLLAPLFHGIQPPASSAQQCLQRLWCSEVQCQGLRALLPVHAVLPELSNSLLLAANALHHHPPMCTCIQEVTYEAFAAQL
eukprot:4128510-Amphidinium_carterae.1